MSLAVWVPGARPADLRTLLQLEGLQVRCVQEQGNFWFPPTAGRLLDTKEGLWAWVSGGLGVTEGLV